MNKFDFTLKVDLAIRYAARETASLSFLRDKTEVFSRYIVEGLKTVGVRSDKEMVGLALQINGELEQSRFLEQVADKDVIHDLVEKMWDLQVGLEGKPSV